MAINGNINKLFVPYEIALKLKEKGFDEECFGNYDCWSKKEPARLMTNIYPYFLGQEYAKRFDKTCILAPLYQQVIDFLETCGIYIRTYPSLLSYPMWWDWELQIKLPYKIISSKDDEQYKNKYEALNKAIEEALKLIL